MKFPKHLSFVAVLLLPLSACTFNMTYTNRAADKEAAQKVTNMLFLDLENKDYNSADLLFSKAFYKTTSKQKLNDIFTMTVDNLGDIQAPTLSECQTKVVSGTNSSGEYAVFYNVRYRYYNGQVSIHLTKDADGNIQIDGYHIKSEGFDGSQ